MIIPMLMLMRMLIVLFANANADYNANGAADADAEADSDADADGNIHVGGAGDHQHLPYTITRSPSLRRGGCRSLPWVQYYVGLAGEGYFESCSSCASCKVIVGLGYRRTV